MKPRSCELCAARASVYCESDSAFLCAACDGQVHAANFLAARHVRTPIDASCSSSWFDATSDSEDADDSASSSVRSAASSCVSTAESAPASNATCRKPRQHRSSRKTRKPSSFIPKTTTASTGEVDARAEAILAAWCARLEAPTGGGSANCSAVVAAHAMGVGLKRFGAPVPPRICAAAAVWFAYKLCCQQGGGGGRNTQTTAGHQNLRRLEECSGVPSRIIAAAESRLARLVRSRQRDAEGWAECAGS